MTAHEPRRAEAWTAVKCWCGEVINLQIPVLVSLYLDDNGTWRINAKVDDETEWAQPAWSHAFNVHGPRDPE